jgi:hypothetical protein
MLMMANTNEHRELGKADHLLQLKQMLCVGLTSNRPGMNPRSAFSSAQSLSLRYSLQSEVDTPHLDLKMLIFWNQIFLGLNTDSLSYRLYDLRVHFLIHHQLWRFSFFFLFWKLSDLYQFSTWCSAHSRFSVNVSALAPILRERIR